MRSPCDTTATARAGCIEPSSLDQSRLTEGREDIAFNPGEIFFFDGITRDEHKIEWLGEFVLMLPIRFAEQTFGATADDSVTNFFADHYT